jgi:hypothetical protein
LLFWRGGIKVYDVVTYDLLIEVVSLKWCSRGNSDFGLGNSFGSRSQTYVLAARFSIVISVVVLSAYM